MVAKKTTKSVDPKSVADVLWDEIKNLPIEMFSLPNQRVLNHVVRKGGTSDNVILSLNSPAVLPSLEVVLNAQKQYRDKVSFAMKAEGENITDAFPKYVMKESDGGYIIIHRYTPETDRPELQSLSKRNDYFIADKEEK